MTTPTTPDTSIDLRVRVQPRSDRPGIGARRGGTLIVRVAAPPVDDAANKEVVKLVSKITGLAKGKISIVKGEKSRDKLLRLEGITAVELTDALDVG